MIARGIENVVLIDVSWSLVVAIAGDFGQIAECGTFLAELSI